MQLCICNIWALYVLVSFVWSLTIFMSLFSLLMPARSLLVAPTLPTSWMEIKGLVPGSTDRTEQPSMNIQTTKPININAKLIFLHQRHNSNSHEVTHHFSEHRILCHSKCSGEDSSTQRDSVSSDSQWPPHL